MDKHFHMTRERFEQINQEQKDSGLSIIDFCNQNAYSVKSFYTWRYKFGVSERITDNDPRPPKMEFSPVNINSGSIIESHDSDIVPKTSSKVSDKSDDSISIEFPGGIQIHFNGNAQSKALAIISKMMSSYVLPE
jgi:putative transposase